MHHSTWLSSSARLVAVVNGRQHATWVAIFMVVVIAHWAEHIVQAAQIFWLGLPRPDSLGLLGEVWPLLIRLEWLHYGYAVLMLIFLAVLRDGFTGRARQFWTLALVIQFWHHFEHLLLLIQAQTGRNLGGSSVPISVLQLFVPRVELHLFYNAIVFVPMVVAVVLHHRAGASGRSDSTCSCGRRRRRMAAVRA